MSKTLLVLGGAEKTLPLVRYARARGHRVVLCDRNENPPCRAEASEFAQVSTTDLPALRALMTARAVDGVLSFGSDLMAVVAARLAEEFGLPGNPPQSVDIMARKDLFRDWLALQGLPAPVARSFGDWDSLERALPELTLPLMIKPVDAAGSTAVQRLDRPEQARAAFDEASAASRDGRVIAESYIERDHPHMIGGDLFVHEGEVLFWGLLNSHRANPRMPYLPTGTSYPLRIAPDRLRLLRDLLADVVRRLGLRFGGFNVEAMFGQDSRLYLIELAPRNGGNAIPELLYRATGFDLIGALVDAALGEPVAAPAPDAPGKAVSNYMLHSDMAGRFVALQLAAELAPHVLGRRLEIEPGAAVEIFDRATRAVGWLDLEFAGSDEQDRLLARMPQLVALELE